MPSQEGAKVFAGMKLQLHWMPLMLWQPTERKKMLAPTWFNPTPTEREQLTFNLKRISFGYCDSKKVSKNMRVIIACNVLMDDEQQPF